MLEPLPLAAGLPSGQDSGGEEGTAARPWAARAFVSYVVEKRDCGLPLVVAPDVFAARGSPSAGAPERGLTRVESLERSDTMLRAQNGNPRARGISERTGY